jgi:hypothetical protein
MIEKSTETRSAVLEREIPYHRQKIQRALAQPHLIGERLMKYRSGHRRQRRRP